MKYQIFQVSYLSKHTEQIDPLFCPLLNIKNENPELRELFYFEKIRKEGLTNHLDAWGIFSPRWKQRLQISAQDIKTIIDTNLGYDIYLFNPRVVADAFFANPWEEMLSQAQNQNYPATKDFLAYILNDLGLSPNPFSQVYYQNVCYGSYFIATQKLWQEYSIFLEKIIQKISETPENLRGAFEIPLDVYKPALTLLPDVTTRLLSTFLQINTYKVFNFQDIRRMLNEKIDPDIIDFIQLVKELKENIYSKGDELWRQQYQKWHSARLFGLTHKPILATLDSHASFASFNSPPMVQL